MFLKSLTLIVFLAAVAVVLLDYRQQRLETMYEMTRLHAQIDQARQSMWSLQIKIADHIEPPALVKAIERAQLKLEPTTTQAAPASNPSDINPTTNPVGTRQIASAD